ELFSTRGVQIETDGGTAVLVTRNARRFQIPATHARTLKDDVVTLGSAVLSFGGLQNLKIGRHSASKLLQRCLPCWIGIGSLNELQFQQRRLADKVLHFGGIVDPRKLHQDGVLG